MQRCTRTPSKAQGERRVGERRSLGRALLGTLCNPCTVQCGWLCWEGHGSPVGALWEPCGSPRPQQALPGNRVGNTTLGAQLNSQGSVRNESRRRSWEATNKQTNNAATRNAKRETSGSQHNKTRDCANANTRRASERASEPSEHHDLTAFRENLYVLVECGIIALDLVPRLHEEALKPLKSTANLVLHYRTRRRGRLARDH